MASHTAARRAVAAGYSDVEVMVDGILGWTAKNEPVQRIGSDWKVRASR